MFIVKWTDKTSSDVVNVACVILELRNHGTATEALCDALHINAAAVCGISKIASKHSSSICYCLLVLSYTSFQQFSLDHRGKLLTSLNQGHV